MDDGANAAGELEAYAFAFAFAFAKHDFRGWDTLFVVTLPTVMIPLQVIFTPSYQVVASLATANSLWGDDHPHDGGGGDPDGRVLAAAVHAGDPGRADRGDAHQRGVGVADLLTDRAAAGGAGGAGWRSSR